jgi:hypothetical protein
MTDNVQVPGWTLISEVSGRFDAGFAPENRNSILSITFGSWFRIDLLVISVSGLQFVPILPLPVSEGSQANLRFELIDV